MKGSFRTYIEIVLLIVIPTFLGSIELFHPAHLEGHVFNTLGHIPNQWLHIHYAQSFLFGLMALAVYYITHKFDGVLAWLTRIAVFIFLITYTVMDAVAGIAVGRLLIYPHTLGMNHQCSIEAVQALFYDPIVGGLGSIYSLTGSYAWLIAIFLTIVLLMINARGIASLKILPALILLLISGISLFISHAAPFGPVAFFSFALAGMWLLIIKWQMHI